MTYHKLFTALLFAATAAAAQPDTRPPIVAYQGGASFGSTICSFAFSIAQSRAKLGQEPGADGDYHGCIEKQKAALKPSYERALKTINKPAAKAALKEHYIATLTTIEGIAPFADERVIDYERRQQANKAKASAAWSRFEVEN